MEAIQSWVSEHKLSSIGALWAAGIGGSLLANSRTGSAMKPSLRLIHARMHAQALTLAVLSSAAACHYYENHVHGPGDRNPRVARSRDPAVPDITNTVEWEFLCPF